MSSPRDPFLPPDLDLSDDDVVETVEVVAEPDLDDADPTEALPLPDRVSGYDGIGTRRESRERALALLYEAEQRQVRPPAAILDDLPVAPDEFAGHLVVGVSDHLAEIDALLGSYSVSWPLERMPAIDRALLRLGSFELMHTEVPIGACISEAVELAKRYSTDDSHKFVNGMLSRVAQEHR